MIVHKQVARAGTFQHGHSWLESTGKIFCTLAAYFLSGMLA